MIAKGNRVVRMFTLNVKMPKVDKVMHAQGSRVVANVDIWHKWIGHVNSQKLKSMQIQKNVTGLPNFKMSDMEKVCEACQFGKQSKHAFAKERNVSGRPLDVIHSNVWGPTRTTSLVGSSYYVTFIDDRTRKVWLYCMKEKSEVF